MIYNKTVETFLSKVHEALGDVPISEKSDMIVDLYDYIEKKAAAESKSVTTIIKGMDSPQDVAGKLRTNRAAYQWDPLKKPFTTRLFHWGILLLSILLLLVFLTMGAVLWKVSPIVQVTPDGTNIFGGLIHFKSTLKQSQHSLPDYRGKVVLTPEQSSEDASKKTQDAGNKISIKK